MDDLSTTSFKMDEIVKELFNMNDVETDDVFVPKYGWKVTLDWSPPVKCAPLTRPRLNQVYGFVMAAFRYLFYVVRRKRKEGRLPIIDSLNPIPWRPIYGVPMGGIGCGAINRGFRGDMCRWSLIPGMYEYDSVPANQFIVSIWKRGVAVYQQVLSTENAPDSLGCWSWQFPASRASYIALFPRAWTVYDISEHRIKLICRQMSPVIPHNYKDSCLPTCVLEWRCFNYGKESADVSIAWVFAGSPSKGLRSTGKISNGCYLRQTIGSMPCCFGVAAKGGGVTTSSSISMNSKAGATPKDLWNSLLQDGSLETLPNIPLCSSDAAVCVCVQCNVLPMTASVPAVFALAWNMPIVHFRDKRAHYRRRYCRWFDHTDLENGVHQLISYAFDHVSEWETKIHEWQQPILNDMRYPDWFKSALFNELYFIVDGGTVWLDRIDQPQSIYSEKKANKIRWNHHAEYGTFGYLEGHEYRMYNTYDVHYYSSWALVTLWPCLQESIQYDITDATVSVDDSRCFYINNGKFEPRSIQYAIPHDAGDPEEEPFLSYNAYIMYNTDRWKDLGPKYVLQVFRDWKLTGNDDYLDYTFPVALEVMKMCISFDKDGDGVIENSGDADQTYDAWMVRGVSAYTGGLWLAAVYAIHEMATHLGKDGAFFEGLLIKGKKSFEDKLWTGSYYRYDELSQSVMADQLCGHWYLKSIGVHDNTVFDQTKVKLALDSIFKFNFKAVGSKWGVINGCHPNGKKDITSVQSEEFWVGVNYAVTACFMLEGLHDKGWAVANSVYRTIYERYGLQFQTPEAYFDDGRFRSLGYMRPLSIWSVYHALNHSLVQKTELKRSDI